jgi:hypothetical protein
MPHAALLDSVSTLNPVSGSIWIHCGRHSRQLSGDLEMDAPQNDLMLPGPSPRPTRASWNVALLYYTLAVLVYFTWVVVVFVPQARMEKIESVRWARQVSEMRWRRSDHWTDVATDRMASAGGKMQVGVALCACACFYPHRFQRVK